MSAVLDPIDRLKTHSGAWHWPSNTKGSSRQTIPAVLWALHDLGGAIEDPITGRCASKLVAHAASIGLPFHPVHCKVGSGLSGLLRTLEAGNFAGCITRETNGKRTYKITLMLSDEQMPPRPAPIVTRQAEDSPPPPLPAAIAAARRPQIGDTRPAPFARVQPAPRPPSVFARPEPVAPAADGPAANGGPSPVEKPEPAPEAPTPAPAPAPEPEPERTLAVVEETPVVELAEVEPELPPLVAVSGDPMAILLQIQQLSMEAFVAIHAQAGEDVEPSTEPAIDPERYANTLHENNRLREKLNDITRKLNDRNDLIIAKTKEISGLRQGLLVAQNNLKTMQDNVDLAPKRERDLARLRGNQRFMEAKPEAAIAGRR